MNNDKGNSIEKPELSNSKQTLNVKSHPIFEVDNLSFSFGSEPIFSNVSFKINTGDFVAIIGINGAGKSTLLRLLLGELSPTAGKIRLFNKDVQHIKDWSSIGYVPQNGFESNNFPATAEEIVKANLYSQIGWLKFPKRIHKEQTMFALKQVGMGEYSKRLISQLSGGQQQRVMLARVIVNNPKIMLLDEPTTGVDIIAVQSLYQLLSKLNKDSGLTIVMVTHDIGRASDFITRALCLEEGSLVELNRKQIHNELLHRHKHP